MVMHPRRNCGTAGGLRMPAVPSDACVSRLRLRWEAASARRRIEMRHGSALCRFVVIVVQPVYFAALHQSKSARFRRRMTSVLNDGRADFGQVTGALLAEWLVVS